MSSELMLRLLISMSEIVIEGIKAIDRTSDDATEMDREAAVARLQSTAEEVKQRLAAMD